MTLKHYVEFRVASGLFISSEVKPAESRDPSKVVLPDYAHAFQFFDREEVDSNGETLRGDVKNRSGVFFVDGTIMDTERVKREVPDCQILLDNMSRSESKLVVRTRDNNFQIFEDGDVNIQTKKPDGDGQT